MAFEELPFDQRFKVLFVLGYVLANVILYIFDKYAPKWKVFHAAASALDNISVAAFAAWAVYGKNPYFVIFVPCFLLFIIYPICYGVNRELSDDEKARLVWMPLDSLTSWILPWRALRWLSIHFLELGTFPFYYLLKSWQRVFAKRTQAES